MPSGPLSPLPLKMTSSIALPRRCFGLCSPSTQRIASTMFDLPQPFGPTMAVTPAGSSSTVRSMNDLNPVSSICLIRILPSSAPMRRRSPGSRQLTRAVLAAMLIAQEHVVATEPDMPTRYPIIGSEQDDPGNGDRAVHHSNGFVRRPKRRPAREIEGAILAVHGMGNVLIQ